MLELNKIYCMDCVEGMKMLLSNNMKFDLIITSPPYNIKDFHSNHLRYDNYRGNDMDEVSYQEWQLECLELMYQLLSDKGSLWYNHKVRISDGKAIHPLEWIFQTDFILKQEIVWNQRKGANVDKRRCFPFSERIYWLTKDKKTEIYNKVNVKDVWDIVPKHTRRTYDHPAVMDIEVVETIYKLHEDTYCDKDNVLVLDPFAGAGTTFAPITGNVKYNYVGFEIDEEYCRNAGNRLRQPLQESLQF